MTSISKCPKCNGKGFVYFYDDEGYEYVTVCECQRDTIYKQNLSVSGVAAEELASKTLENFKTDTPCAGAMKNLAVDFLEKGGRGIGYFGESGTGKTHICLAICQELVKRSGRPFYYFPYRKEIQTLSANYFDELEYPRLIKKWSNAPILYIDDLFKFSVDQTGKPVMRELQMMYDIINNRWMGRNLITIFSSEKALSDIVKMDEALGSRIYSLIEPFGMRCEGKNRRIER